jgi:hypothetical protein
MRLGTSVAAQELDELVRSLPPALRARVAAEWGRTAQAEHASIASFARFSLELLAVGAPPELVRDAHRAGVDEIAHAEQAFAIASVYSGTPVGPGPLPIDPRTLSRLDLESVVSGTVEEGCVGETLSAAEAEAARDAATSSFVRQALARVARDEASHASLAFRFVSWAIGVGGAPARDAARRSFAHAIARCRSETWPEGVSDLALRAHGKLPPAERGALRLKVLETVLVPAANELLALPSLGRLA